MNPNTKIARLAFWSIVIAFAVMALKFFAWYVTGSVALYSDALESIVNVIAAFLAFFAVRVSHKAADLNHPYGHHKAEYLSAVGEGVLIIVAALLIVAEAVRAIQFPRAIEAPDVGLAVNALAALVNFVWALILIRVGKREKSPALVADGNHVMSDVATSFGVLLGIGAALVTGWYILDPILALLVAINILWQGWKIVGSSIQGLMDSAVDPMEHLRIRDVISGNSTGAIEVHDLKTRIAGRATFIEFHLVVDADMTVRDSHAICDRIEEALRTEIENVRITIHVEPDHKAKLPPGTGAVPFA
ncbi:MAG: cation transporter [Rhodobiaceae bacterium]|nr:cation transporter [Rhodobiaceae bacterium]MCC0053503.1 cation transporter [Rhodobiaceae bacterium]